jgi:hypothetical protein
MQRHILFIIAGTPGNVFLSFPALLTELCQE